ncbi:hypothetical protein ACK3YV_07325 [Aeromonas caviae]
MIKNYQIASGGTFRQRIPRTELQDFSTISNDGTFWIGTHKMTVSFNDEYIELLISNTSGMRKGDHEYKVTAQNEYGDTLILVMGRIRVIG